MPQANIFLPAVNPNKAQSPLKVDSNGTLLTGGELSTSLNITAATVVKATPGKLVKISVLVAGSAAGTANDCITTGAAATANEIAVIPNSVGILTVDWPCTAGITITPGTGQTLAVSYD